MRLQAEIEEGESEGEEDFPNEEGGEEMEEDKTSKLKATSDSDEEAHIATKEESTVNTNSSTNQRNAPKKLMNQFNFFERCALTEEIILRVILINFFVIFSFNNFDIVRIKKFKQHHQQKIIFALLRLSGLFMTRIMKII